jgi:SH3 domain protein
VPRCAVFIALLCALSFAYVAAARAEESWAVGAPLELRSGASFGYRVLASIAPGERLEVLQKGDGWVRVRTAAGMEGWVIESHVNATAPPLERVGQLEAEAARLRAELAGLTAEREHLRTSAGELEGRDAERTAELDRLLRENARLSAGERWVEWTTGAGILACGLLGGALLRGFLAGRRASRIRL